MNKMILCTDSKNGIGKNGTIPWHSTEDFQHFKKETENMRLLMGYHTWLSLPHKPLPGRLNIVVTSREVPKNEIHENVLFINKEGLADFLHNNDNIMVIGGSTIYKIAIHYVDEVILSRIDGDYECDTFFNLFEYDVLITPKKMVELSNEVTAVYYNISNWG